MSVVKDIDKLIEWYQASYAGASLHHLMDAKSRLLTLCYRYSEEESASKRNSIIATVYRKSEHHKIKAQLIDEGMTQGLAESKTIDQIKDTMNQEAEHEALAYHQKRILDISLKIIEDLSQRISVLKKEMENSRGQT